MDELEIESIEAVTPTARPPAISRRRRLLYAVATSGFSKVLASIVQFGSLPIALSALGTDRYAAFLALRGSLAWVSLLTLGLIPTLPRFIAAASNRAEPQQARDLVMSSILFMGALGLSLMAVLELFPIFVSPSAVVGHSRFVSAGELSASYQLVAILMPIQLAVSVIPAIRSGYQELHISYLWSSVANLVVIGALLIVRNLHPTIWLLFYALYLPLVLFNCCDVALLAYQRPFLLSGRFSFAPAARLVGNSALNGMGMQLSYFFLSYLPIVWLSHFTNAQSTAAFGSVMQLLLAGSTAMTLIYHPLVQAVANAHSLGDFQWLKRNYIRAAVMVVGLSFAAFVTLSTAGPWLITVWLHKDLGVSHLLCALLGLYFFLLMSSMFHFYLLSAMGHLEGVGIVYLLEGAVATGLGLFLTQIWGSEGMAAALVVSVMLCSGWFLPMRAWRALWPPSGAR